jgi:ABC-type spermidine/putrescine transport system permease subunit I
MDAITALPVPLLLLFMAVVAFVQNMAFTAVSRSRNAGDVGFHRRCSWASNGVWFFTQVLLFNVLWSSLTTGALWKIAVVGVVYVFATTEGSCLMMAKMLKIETGKRQVGAR